MMMYFLFFIVFSSSVVFSTSIFDMTPGRDVCQRYEADILRCVFKGKGFYHVGLVQADITRVYFDRFFLSDINLDELPNLRTLSIQTTDLRCDEVNGHFIKILNGVKCDHVTTMTPTKTSTHKITEDVLSSTTKTSTASFSSYLSTDMTPDPSSHQPEPTTTESSLSANTHTAPVSYPIPYMKIFIPLMVLLTILLFICTVYVCIKKCKKHKRHVITGDIENIQMQPTPSALFPVDSESASSAELFEQSSSRYRKKNTFLERLVEIITTLLIVLLFGLHPNQNFQNQQMEPQQVRGHVPPPVAYGMRLRNRQHIRPPNRLQY